MNKDSQSSLGILYSGRSRHAIDASNRIMLRFDWRQAGTPTQFLVMTHPSEACLVVYPPAAFETLLSELRARTADKNLLAQIERGLNDRICRVVLDAQGRLPLPPELMSRVGLAKQGELVGRFSRFEVWPCDKYQAVQTGLEQATASALNNLEAL